MRSTTLALAVSLLATPVAAEGLLDQALAQATPDRLQLVVGDPLSDDPAERRRSWRRTLLGAASTTLGLLAMGAQACEGIRLEGNRCLGEAVTPMSHIVVGATLATVGVGMMSWWADVEVSE